MSILSNITITYTQIALILLILTALQGFLSAIVIVLVIIPSVKRGPRPKLLTFEDGQAINHNIFVQNQEIQVLKNLLNKLMENGQIPPDNLASPAPVEVHTVEGSKPVDVKTEILEEMASQFTQMLAESNSTGPEIIPGKTRCKKCGQVMGKNHECKPKGTSRLRKAILGEG